MVQRQANPQQSISPLYQIQINHQSIIQEGSWKQPLNFRVKIVQYMKEVNKLNWTKYHPINSHQCYAHKTVQKLLIKVAVSKFSIFDGESLYLFERLAVTTAFGKPSPYTSFKPY